MSKLSITPSTVEVANIQALPDLVVGQASSLKQTFDKTGADTNEYINDVLIPELNGNDGANKIGLSNPELASDNVGDGITEVLQVAKDAQAGTIIDGSIEDVKLSNAPGQIKDRVATNTSNISTNTSNISTNATNFSNFSSDFEYPEATVVSREIQVTKLGTNAVSRFKLSSAIVVGTVISISLDGGVSSLPLKDVESNDVLELEVGFYEVIADATFFTLRPSGGSGGLWLNDWSAYTPVYNLTGTGTSTAANTYRTFVDISGEGFLTFVRGFILTTNNPLPPIRITIDGVVYEFEGGLTSPNGEAWGNMLLNLLYFKTSLKVEVKNPAASSNNVACDFHYWLKNSKPNQNVQTVLNSTSRKSVAINTNSTSNVDVLNVSGSGYLIGFEIGGYYVSASAIAYLGLVVDGLAKATDRIVLNTGDISYKQNIFPLNIRFNTNVTLRIRTSNNGSNFNIKAFYTLD